MKAADPFTGSSNGGGVVERQPGQFARHAKTGAPYVAHPTETTKHNGKKADLIALCAARSIAVPEKVTVAQLQELLGPRPTRVQYGRPSSLGKQIENMTNIQKWSERAVALGVFLDPHPVFAELGRLDDSQRNLDDAEARELLDKIAVRAKSTAQAGLAADRGTHHHELTEDHDNERDPVLRMAAGEELGVPANVQAALVAAWAKMLADFDIEILATEAQCVDDVWRQAGTLDRICRLRRELRFITVTGEYVTLPAGWVGILDIKTGRLRLDYGGFVAYWHGYAVQLASYAQSVPYDPDTDQRSTWAEVLPPRERRATPDEVDAGYELGIAYDPVEIDQRWAVIAHLDVLAALEGEAVCRLVLVDLEAGRHAGNLCVAARDWEKRTDVFSIPTDDLAVRVPVQIATAGASPSAPAVATDVVSAPPAPEPPRAVPDATHCDPAVDTGADTTTSLPGSPLMQGDSDTPVESPYTVESHGQEPEAQDGNPPSLRPPGAPPRRASSDADETATPATTCEHCHDTGIEPCDNCGTRDDDCGCIIDGCPYGASPCRRKCQPTIAPPEQPLPPAPEADTPATPDALTSVERQQAGAAVTAPAPLSPLRQAQEARKRIDTEADAKRRLHDTPEEGTMSDDRTFLLLQHRFEKLPKAGKDWIGHLGREAADAKVSFSSKDTKTSRRYEILRSLIVLAERDESDDAVRDLLALVDPRIAQLGSVPLGHIVGSLSAAEAATFAQLVNDELTVVIDDDGTTKLVAA